MSEEEISTENNTAIQSKSTTNGDISDTVAAKKTKSKKPTMKEFTEEDESGFQNEPAKASKAAKMNESSRKKNRKNEIGEDEEKQSDNGIKRVPLLDQNPIVDGPRNRKMIVNLGPAAKTTKYTGIDIPTGKGTPLGRIPIVNTRMKRLTVDEIKSFHRFLFGKLGKIEFLTTNIQRFNGFSFEKDSDQYGKKLVALNKHNVHLLKEYQFFLDLDLKIKKKEEVSKAILDFLLKPFKTENSVNPAVVTHPKRKATKRNYYEKDFAEDRKAKKKKPSKTAKDKETASSETEKTKTPKTIKTKNKVENADGKEAGENENVTIGDNSQELTKPAKKRKRNQIIEEVEQNADDSKTKKSKESDETKSKLEVSDKKTLTDEELKEFLKKVLADANLEKTTMKTVYSLINMHYPNYNFASKKDLIKEIVKSLIQS